MAKIIQLYLDRTLKSAKGKNEVTFTAILLVETPQAF